MANLMGAALATYRVALKRYDRKIDEKERRKECSDARTFIGSGRYWCW
jgi:hypothetical protein